VIAFCLHDVAHLSPEDLSVELQIAIQIRCGCGDVIETGCLWIFGHERPSDRNPGLYVNELSASKLVPPISHEIVGGRSHDQTFVQPSRNFHRPTHATGSMQCTP
jgi:hypothetical protein